jgi:hypothetical protein
MSENTVNETVQDNPNEAGEQLVTPYRAAAIVNALFQEEGIDREVKPQMLYQYAKKGSIPTVQGAINTRTGEPSRLIRMADLAEWYVKFRDGQLARGGGVSLKDQAAGLKALINK